MILKERNWHASHTRVYKVLYVSECLKLFYITCKREHFLLYITVAYHEWHVTCSSLFLLSLIVYHQITWVEELKQQKSLKKIICFVIRVRRCLSLTIYKILNQLIHSEPFTPKVNMHILHTVLHTFPKRLTRRICFTIKSCFSRWSSPLLSWLSCLIQGWYCKEKSDAGHFQALKG